MRYVKAEPRLTNPRTLNELIATLDRTRGQTWSIPYTLTEERTIISRHAGMQSIKEKASAGARAIALSATGPSRPKAESSGKAGAIRMKTETSS